MKLEGRDTLARGGYCSGDSHKSLQPPPQALAGSLARVDNLLSREVQELGNARVFQGQFVPHFVELFRAHLERLRQFAKARNPGRGEEEYATVSSLISQIEEQRYALIEGKAAHLFPEALQKDPFFDMPRRIRFCSGCQPKATFSPSDGLRGLFHARQHRSQRAGQATEFNRASEVVENRRQD